MAILNKWTDITCPAACDDEFLLPALPSDPDCLLPPVLAQISDLFITPCGVENSFDWTATPVDAVANAIDNTDITNTKTKHLVGTGEIGDHSPTVYEGPKLTRLITKRRYTLNFTVLVTDQEVYDFLRYFHCNWQDFSFQWANLGGNLFGDTDGVRPSLVDVFFTAGGGNEDVEQARLQIEFDTTNGFPRRSVNPLTSSSACMTGVVEGVEGV